MKSSQKEKLSSEKEETTRRNSLEDQAENQGIKIRHESSDSAISSGSALSPVKFIKPINQLGSYLCF